MTDIGEPPITVMIVFVAMVVTGPDCVTGMGGMMMVFVATLVLPHCVSGVGGMMIVFVAMVVTDLTV